MKDARIEEHRVLPELPPSFDRRHRERVPLRIPVRILSCGLLMEKSDLGTCTDLCEGGVAFDSEAELNVGDVVVLEFVQRGESAYRCHARLTYRMGRHYGGYFLASE
ncbi:MAG TPA: PilZ domain-containing protein [Candidatus Binatia bacterium]|nr:PilZ domain-containing protein [Candidatus Binatia bacterium]